MTVYVVEEGEYSDRYVAKVYASLEAAKAHRPGLEWIASNFSPTRWDATFPGPEDDGWSDTIRVSAWEVEFAERDTAALAIGRALIANAERNAGHGTLSDDGLNRLVGLCNQEMSRQPSPLAATAAREPKRGTEGRPEG